MAKSASLPNMATAKQVGPLYRVVVDSVIKGVKEAFLDDGVDEQVLLELKQLWENKLAATKAVEHTAEPDKRQTEQAAGHLLRDQGCNTQQVKQGLVAQRAVLAAAPQQPASVSLPGNQSELAGAATQATITLPVGIFPRQLAALGVNAQGNITLQATPSGQVIAVQNIGGQPTAIAIPQQALISQRPVPTQQVAENSSGVHQLDGTGDGSSSSEDEDFDNDNDDNEEEQNDDDGDQGEEEEPLNSDDDISEEDPTELFDSENLVVCQYDKINRNKNKWKFTLKDGIMTLNGKDFVFQRAVGDAEW